MGNGWLDLSKDITLSDSIRNYRYLEFQYDVLWKQTNTYGTEGTQLIATEQLAISNSSSAKTDSYIEFIVGGQVGLMGYFTSEKNLHISGAMAPSPNTSSYSGFRLRRIYGIK